MEKPKLVAHYVHRVALRPLFPVPLNAGNILSFNCLAIVPPLAHGVQFPLCLPAWGKEPECHLTTLFENASVPTVAANMATAIDAPATPKRRGWLPLLTVLFLISYGLMTALIVEQGATIESQRALIRELFRDSTELSALRSRAQQEKTVADTQSHGQTPSVKTQVPLTPGVSTTPSTQTPSTQIPSTEAPSTQAPVTTVPSSQAAQQHRTQSKAVKQKPQFQMPTKPASDLVDDPRNLNVI
jgi:cytoskeletal protein RodZ